MVAAKRLVHQDYSADHCLTVGQLLDAIARSGVGLNDGTNIVEVAPLVGCPTGGILLVPHNNALSRASEVLKRIDSLVDDVSSARSELASIENEISNIREAIAPPR